MRFSRFTVENFGCIQEWRSPKLGTDPVVFYGPNEAGKSTLFHLLSTLLYGYHPANREQFPYTPRDGGMPAGHASIYLADGTKVDIYRRCAANRRDNWLKIMLRRSFEIGQCPSRHMYRGNFFKNYLP